MLDILVADDDEVVVTALSRYLSQEGHKVKGVTSMHDLDSVLSNNYDLIVCDLRLNSTYSGIDLLDAANADDTDTVIVLMSSSMPDNQRRDLMDRGAMDCLQKPFFKATCSNLLKRVTEPR